MLLYVVSVIAAIALGWSSCLLWQSATNTPQFVEINNKRLFEDLGE